MRVGMGDVAAGEEEGDPFDCESGFQHLGDFLAQNHDGAGEVFWKLIEGLVMLDRHDLHMSGADRPVIEECNEAVIAVNFVSQMRR